MKKKLFFRLLLGIPLGIALGYVISILISLGRGEGAYSPCMPQLEAHVGSEIGAVVLQAALCGLIGAGFSAGSLIWEVERWSLVRQTITHFLLSSLIMLPIAYFTYWMEHSLWGFLRYFGIFAGIFAGIWLSQYLSIRRQVAKMNEKLQ